MLYLQIDLIVINGLLGPTAAGQYAALAQWSFLIRSLSGTIFPLFSPSIMHSYARNDTEALVRYARWGVKVMGLILALPIGLIAGLGKPLLTCWLGASYSQFGWLLFLMVIHLPVNVSVSPLFVVQAATKFHQDSGDCDLRYRTCEFGTRYSVDQGNGVDRGRVGRGNHVDAKEYVFHPNICGMDSRSSPERIL